MVTKLCIRIQSLPFSVSCPVIRFPSNRSSYPKTLIFSLFSSTSKIVSYGPSLHRGETPSRNSPKLNSINRSTETDNQNRKLNEEGDDKFLDESEFTRIFDIAALRVPAKDCFALESRLRGHLLNWPRIRNIARVPGDEVDEDVVKLLGSEKSYKETEESVVNSVDRRIDGKAVGDGERLNQILHREKLAKTFNCRGYVSFRNLAKISRPKRKVKDGRVKDGEGRGKGKNDFAVVEVVEEDEEDDMAKLLGEGYGGGGGRWKGSTRLLLLDEKFAGKGVEELPQAVKVLFMEDDSIPSIELVKCKLTLFYDYWQMNEILEALLPNGMIIPSAFEIVGHIAHLNLRDEHFPYRKLIAKVVLDKNNSKIQTVVNKTDAIHNDYRTMQLEVLAGNHSLVTTVIENGLRFQFDLATVYWSSRLATERQRLLYGFKNNDVVCDVFAGVGPIAIAAAKIVERVYANDLNPRAVDYMERNSVINKLERKIEIFNMDARRFIDAMFSSDKGQKITQVVMNLPNDAAEYLDAFRGIYKNRPKEGNCSLPTIHVYGFSRAQDPEFDFHERIRIGIQEVAVNVEMRKVRLVAPGKWMLCASFVLPKTVAFAERRTVYV